MDESARAESGRPIGIITEIHGPAIISEWDRLPPLRQALRTDIGDDACLFEVHQHLDERHVRAITLHRSTGLRRGMAVVDTGSPPHVPVSPDCLGRLLNIFGEPLDGGAPISTQAYRNIHSQPPGLDQTVGPGDTLESGIKVRTF